MNVGGPITLNEKLTSKDERALSTLTEAEYIEREMMGGRVVTLILNIPVKNLVLR